MSVDVDRAVIVDRSKSRPGRKRDLTNTLSRRNRDRCAGSGAGAGERVSRGIDARAGVVHQGAGVAGGRNRELAYTLSRGNRQANW